MVYEVFFSNIDVNRAHYFQFKNYILMPIEDLRRTVHITGSAFCVRVLEFMYPAPSRCKGNRMRMRDNMMVHEVFFSNRAQSSQFKNYLLIFIEDQRRTARLIGSVFFCQGIGMQPAPIQNKQGFSVGTKNTTLYSMLLY